MEVFGLNIEQVFEKLHEGAQGIGAINCSKEVINNILKGKGEVKTAYLEIQMDPNKFTIWIATEKTIEKLIYDYPNVNVQTIQLKDIVDFRKEYELTGDGRPGKEHILKKIQFTSNGEKEEIVRPEYDEDQKRYQEFGNIL